MLNVKIDSSKWDDFVERYNRDFSEHERNRILNKAASYVDFKILERTASGVDVYGNEFIPYAPMSVRLRSAKGLPTRKVDLFFTGRMLNALTHEADSDVGKVFFLPGGSPSPAEKALKNNQTRPFFGVSDDDVKAVFKIVDDEIDRLLK